jgi:hypothetical protein
MGKSGTHGTYSEQERLVNVSIADVLFQSRWMKQTMWSVMDFTQVVAHQLSDDFLREVNLRQRYRFGTWPRARGGYHERTFALSFRTLSTRILTLDANASAFGPTTLLTRCRLPHPLTAWPLSTCRCRMRIDSGSMMWSCAWIW